MDKRKEEKAPKKELFEELSVKELEDRLELANRCVCRIRPA